MTAIGFVGLGKMGGPMARNLLRAGHRLKVYDLSSELRQELRVAGAEVAESLAWVAANVEIVITVLPGGDGHSEVFTAPGGLFEGARRGTLFIDCSTTAVETARAIASAAAEAGHAAIDAPISGGVTGARDATLTFMLGGPEESVRRAERILEAMGRRIIHTGAAGSGAAAKICNNLIVGITTVAVSEAFALSERLGLAADKLFAVTSQSSAQSWVLEHLCPAPGVVPDAPASRGYKANGTSKMLLKDLQLAQQAALGSGAAIPLGASTTALYALFCLAGGGSLDSSAIIKMIAGLPIPE